MADEFDPEAYLDSKLEPGQEPAALGPPPGLPPPDDDGGDDNKKSSRKDRSRSRSRDRRRSRSVSVSMSCACVCLSLCFVGVAALHTQKAVWAACMIIVWISTVCFVSLI